MSDNKNDNGVGYGIPPKHTQFKSGQSGNPKGRPKGAKNLGTILDRTISERLIVTENGKRKKISKLEATVKQLVNKAASGDHKSGQQLLHLVQMIQSRADGMATIDATGTATDQVVMSNILTRIRNSADRVENCEGEPQLISQNEGTGYGDANSK